MFQSENWLWGLWDFNFAKRKTSRSTKKKVRVEKKRRDLNLFLFSLREERSMETKRRKGGGWDRRRALDLNDNKLTLDSSLLF